MPAPAAHRRARREIDRLVHRGLTVPALARAVTPVLAQAVPFEGTCLLTLDPATLLPTAEVVEHGLPGAAMVRLSEIELREHDVNKFTALARAPRPAAGLAEATEGELDRSLRQRELRRPEGFEDELRTVLADATGTWGALTLLRESRRPHFTPSEVAFVASIAGLLGDGVRRAVALGDATDPAGPEETGFLVLAPDHSVELANAAADRWLDELGTSERTAGLLPVVVHSVAARARAHAADPPGDARREDAHEPARARVRTGAGRWVVLDASVLGDGPDARVAVVVEPAHGPELAPLVADAHGLTDRERRVTELVARGWSTNDIAGALHLAAYTVQDHLKSIFDKTGTGSRGELVARLFFDHHLPRLLEGRPAPGALLDRRR
jgi:DNA-binding CsgD family transcriptional regulator